MTSILLKVDGAQAWATVTGPLTAGMVGLPVTISCDKTWDGLTKNLVCRCDELGSEAGESRMILNVGEAAVVAHEVMQAGKYLYLGLEGYSPNGQLVIPTTWARSENPIQSGANSGTELSAEPTLPVWSQLQAQIDQLEGGALTQEDLIEIRSCSQIANQAANVAASAVAAAEQAAARAEEAADKLQQSPETPNITDEQIAGAVSGWLTEHPEATTTVADKSITPAKTTFIEPVRQNLIDISRVVKGSQGETGIQPGGSPGGAGYTTDYIPVEVGKTYRCNVGFGTSGWSSSWYYDSGKNPVAVISGNPFTVPEGVAYARLTWYYSDDPAVKKYALFEGTNIWPFTQGIQRYELDEMLTTAVERVVDAYAAVKAVPKNLYKQAGFGNVNGSTGAIECGETGSLRVSDYIEITPSVFYVSNCLSALGFTACYDADKQYVAAFADVSERFGIDGYYGFRITDPNVRYIVNGCEKTISKPISEPFFCRGSSVPETFEGYDVAVPHADVVEALKKLLGVSGNELAGLTWAVLGDSTTAGSGNTQTYHGIIAEEEGLTAINYGVNGSWVSYTAAMDGQEMCTRFENMTNDADIITVMGGINDINNVATLGQMGDAEKTTFYGALDILCRGLHRKYPGKRIGYITPMNYGDDAKAEPYLEAIHAVCGKYAIPVFDMYHEGLVCGTNEELSTMYFRDGLHQNDFGHTVQARKIKAFLRMI